MNKPLSGIPDRDDRLGQTAARPNARKNEISAGPVGWSRKPETVLTNRHVPFCTMAPVRTGKGCRQTVISPRIERPCMSRTRSRSQFCPIRYLRFVTALSVVMSRPLTTPHSCKRLPVSYISIDTLPP